MGLVEQTTLPIQLLCMYLFTYFNFKFDNRHLNYNIMLKFMATFRDKGTLLDNELIEWSNLNL